MEWPTIIGEIAVAAVASYLIYVWTRRRKVASRRGEQLISHLRKIGVQASWASRGTIEQKLGSRPILGWRSEGVIKIEGRNMDYISIVSEINQYKHWGVRYFFDYLVKSSGWVGGRQNHLHCWRWG